MSKKNMGIAFLCLLTFAIGILLGRAQNQNNSDVSQKEIRTGGHKFTNPLLECDIAQGKINKELASSQSDLQYYIQNATADNVPSRIAVYFRDLNNGLTFGVQDEERFVPASLLKVPVMMAYFKDAENDPTLLSKKIVFEKKFDIPQIQNVPPEEQIQVGHIYTIEELIEHMVIYSDNQALLLLQQYVNVETLKDVYIALNIDFVSLSHPDSTIQLKEVARFLRVLFNASYLSETYSEKALDILSRTKYKTGIVAGVPSDISVAHKFGEATFKGGSEIHDCGIVYYPNHPYLLCIMTEGNSFQGLENSIQDISRIVYKNVSSQVSSAPQGF